jgi:hypothetical protein
VSGAERDWPGVRVHAAAAMLRAGHNPAEVALATHLSPALIAELGADIGPANPVPPPLRALPPPRALPPTRRSAQPHDRAARPWRAILLLLVLPGWTLALSLAAADRIHHVPVLTVVSFVLAVALLAMVVIATARLGRD